LAYHSKISYQWVKFSQLKKEGNNFFWVSKKDIIVWDISSIYLGRHITRLIQGPMMGSAHDRMQLNSFSTNPPPYLPHHTNEKKKEDSLKNYY
jgi:hypothetical protein